MSSGFSTGTNPVWKAVSAGIISEDVFDCAAFRIFAGVARIIPFPVLRSFLMRDFTIAYDIGLLRRQVVETSRSVGIGRAATPRMSP